MTREELKAACNALPLTQAEIASRIGVSYGHLRNALSGTQTLGKPSLMLLEMLVKELGVGD